MNSPLPFGFNTPFAEQLAFFRAKLNLPTERWDDIKRAAHDRAFIVAGAGKADLLNDLKRAVDKAIEKGTGLDEFRRDFKQIVFNRGWTGWTGEGTRRARRGARASSIRPICLPATPPGAGSSSITPTCSRRAPTGATTMPTA